MQLNAEYTRLNPVDSETVVQTYKVTKRFRWWVPVLVTVDVAATAGCALWIIITVRKKKKSIPSVA